MDIACENSGGDFVGMTIDAAIRAAVMAASFQRFRLIYRWVRGRDGWLRRRQTRRRRRNLAAGQQPTYDGRDRRVARLAVAMIRYGDRERGSAANQIAFRSLPRRCDLVLLAARALAGLRLTHSRVAPRERSRAGLCQLIAREFAATASRMLIQ